MPEHIRAWTSRPVLDVEADLVARLAARAGQPAAAGPPAGPLPAGAAGRLDAGQAAAVAALAGDRPLVVVEGAAGAGKTTTLAATRDLLERAGAAAGGGHPDAEGGQGRRAPRSARPPGRRRAWPSPHGWRWNDDGAWTRLAVGEADPVTGRIYAGPAEGARLRPGDLLVVDEAGMLDQDTARALLTVADEAEARLALLGDRHQLAAVGRGGVLDLAAAPGRPGRAA